MSAAMLCPYCHDDDFKGSSDLISLSLENKRDAGAVVYITPEEQIMEPSDEPEQMQLPSLQTLTILSHLILTYLFPVIQSENLVLGSR